MSHLQNPADLSENETECLIMKPNLSEESIHLSKISISQKSLLAANEKESSFQKLYYKNTSEEKSCIYSDDVSQNSKESEVLQESDEGSKQLTLEEETNTKRIPCRLDNVWTPIVRRYITVIVVFYSY
jgi:hypothetical protein